MLFALCAAAAAQQPKKIPRIGLLSYNSASLQAPRVKTFREGLRDLGYIEGQSIIVESRYADGKPERLSTLAAELVHLKVDVIVTLGNDATRPAKAATSTIPIVMTQDNDPVASGFVASLARPGGNITGLTTLSPELSGKRLELLREVAPKVSLVAVILDPTSSGTAITFKETEVAAHALRVKLQPFEVSKPEDFDGAFQKMTQGRVGAFMNLGTPLFNRHRKRIVDFAAKSKLPAIYHRREFVEEGGLMSYDTSQSDRDRRAAYFVDKILKGAKPADLPVEQPMKFEFIVNLKAAKQIGLTIPPNVLVRADRVIR
jgi:putative ABC transport system substrate-binding protein